MPYMDRRVFFGRIGMGEPLIQHLRQFGDLARQFGAPVDFRILSDYNSGRTDRIVMERVVEEVHELLDYGSSLDNPEALKALSTWNDRLNELIHYAEAEFWQVHT